ncbi:MAG TPA: hypothetical protein VLV50_15145 [Stellaceae bacterium]|nr:hypothetical protein [Stellaceae bacterium]
MTDAYLYAVRCNFTDPAQLPAWNAWYGGPKMDEMLGLPYFISVQRYEAVALDTGRKYLALWRVERPEAFETPEYRAQWGFAQWTPFIRDWSRDLYRGPAEIDAALDVKEDERLHVISFDGASEAAANASRGRVSSVRRDMIWLEAMGLDRHSPLLGIAKRASGWTAEPVADAVCQETLLAPMMARRRGAKRPT